MEDLLHERLKDASRIINHVRTLDDAVPVMKGADGKDLFCQKEAAIAIADEIERCYIPRPRFEDGEPVQGFDKDERVNYYYVYDDGSWVLRPVGEDGSDLDEINGKAGEPVKLPTPKVYDADGVEIKVGDTVYNIHSGCSVPVIGISDNGRVQWRNEGGGSGFWEPEKCTHERPVFDAEGMRICNGDTVWDVRNPEYRSMTVVDIELGRVFCSDGAPGRIAYAPEWLTKREPDSIQKLKEELCSKHDWHEMSRDDLGAFCMGLCSRIQDLALIERGA